MVFISLGGGIVMEVILNINNLNYGESLLDMSMYIDKNRITSIAGANNSGKTSLIIKLNQIWILILIHI